MSKRAIILAAAFGAVALLAAAGLLYARLSPHLVKVPTGSMEPTIHRGDHVWVAKVSDDVQRGSIVMFLYPKRPTDRYVMRAVAVGGDTVEMKGTEVLVNGKPIAERRTRVRWGIGDAMQMREVTNEGAGPYTVYYLIDELRAEGPDHGHYGVGSPYTVPDGAVFVLGDNRDNAEDSRYWGPVPLENVLGIAKYVYAEEHRDGSLVRIHRDLE